MTWSWCGNMHSTAPMRLLPRWFHGTSTWFILSPYAGFMTPILRKKSPRPLSSFWRARRDHSVRRRITQKEGISDEEVHLHIHATPSAEGLHSGKVIVIMKKVGNEWKQTGDL